MDECDDRQREPNHEPGRQIVAAVDHGELPTGVVTNEALLETLNFVRDRADHTLAVELLNRLVEGDHFRLPSGPTENDGVGRSRVRRHDRLSLGDPMLVASKLGEGIESVYGFDDEFDVINGITQVNAAVNPYE